MDKLLPCPFCGGKARWMYLKPIGRVMCKKCGASSAALSDNYEEADCQQEAIAAWNRRADDERFKNALKEIINLACESVEREKTLAKLEAEVMALEPKCGEWVKKTYTHEYANEETEERQYVVCSICGKQPPSGFGTVYYCPNCGAKMEDKL